MPTNFNPMTATLKEPALLHEVAEVEKSIQYLVRNMPTHRDFVRKYCPAVR